MTAAADLPALHEFVPYPISRPNHVCTGYCCCHICGFLKGYRTVHYQTRDRRRPEVPA